MAKIHDKYVIELAEVIKGYGNDPDVKDPFELSLFYRFYELPNIAIQRENFLKMKPLEPRKGKWIEKEVHENPKAAGIEEWQSCKCSVCGRYDTRPYSYYFDEPHYCSWCGADMRGEEHDR